MFQETVSDKLGAMRGVGVDDILAALGLERRRTFTTSMIPIASGFAAGALVGAGLALLFAPKSGREMRDDLRKRADEVGRKVTEAAEGAAAEVRNALPQSLGGEGRTAKSEVAERRVEPMHSPHLPSNTHSPMK
jgi:gas vesicle protein